MADVIHRTTLEFNPSANSPDFPEPTWKWRPDMTAVSGVPRKHWKAPADWDAVGAGPVEMTAGEKATADANEMAATRAATQASRIASSAGFYARLQSDQVRSVVTYADVPDLFLPVLANKEYTFRVFVMYTAAVATTGIGLQLTGPASPTYLRYCVEICTSTSARVVNSGSAFGTAHLGAASAGAPAVFARFDGYLLNGVNAGNVQLQFRSEIDTSAVTILRGSYMEIR